MGRLSSMVKRKYGNKKVTVNGINFDSKREAFRYTILRARQDLGEISGLQLQVKFVLQDKFKKNGKTIREISYIADFVYIEDGKMIVEDSKGFRTKDYILKKKMFEYRYRDLTIREV